MRLEQMRGGTFLGRLKNGIGIQAAVADPGQLKETEQLLAKGVHSIGRCNTIRCKSALKRWCCYEIRELGLSAIDKREIWSRWKAGQTLHEIGRAYGKRHNTIRAVLLPRGGILPVARRRSRLALTFAEREDISRGMASGSSIREIASCLHRAASTVSREIARHGGRSIYRAYDADQQAWNAALRPKLCLLSVSSELRDLVASRLILDWSPEQIATGTRKLRRPLLAEAIARTKTHCSRSWCRCWHV